jgi:hypothetical protein
MGRVIIKTQKIISFIISKGMMTSTGNNTMYLWFGCILKTNPRGENPRYLVWTRLLCQNGKWSLFAAAMDARYSLVERFVADSTERKR